MPNIQAADHWMGLSHGGHWRRSTILTLQIFGFPLASLISIACGNVDLWQA